MNPFDLPGPEFLLFYAVVGALLLLGLVWARRRAEAGSAHVRLTDPYLIACLRGGPNEALRVATVALVDRGLLKTYGSTLAVAGAGEAGLVHHPVEQALLDKFSSAAQAATVFSDPTLRAATRELESTLERHRLLPDQATRSARVFRLLMALGFFWALGFIKLLVALSRGRRNVLLLFVLAAVFAVAGGLLASPRRTRTGDEVMADLRTLFSGLKDRRLSLSPQQPDEVALLSAVYGIGALPYADWAYARQLYPRAQSRNPNCGVACGTSSSWSGTSVFSCGSSSSCGSSGDSSGGSSCGGGGCGGGCGGCGS